MSRVKSVLYQVGSMYAIHVCNVLSLIHNQLRISLIRVFEKALVKNLVKKLPESLQERTRFWIISWARRINFTSPHAVWHSVSYVLSSGQKPYVSRLYRTTCTAILCHVVVCSKLSVSQNILMLLLKYFFLIMVSFISLESVLIQFLLFRQERRTYNRKVCLMKRC
jgi:hypothetical protein